MSVRESGAGVLPGASFLVLSILLAATAAVRPAAVAARRMDRTRNDAPGRTPAPDSRTDIASGKPVRRDWPTSADAREPARNAWARPQPSITRAGSRRQLLGLG